MKTGKQTIWGPKEHFQGTQLHSHTEKLSCCKVQHITKVRDAEPTSIQKFYSILPEKKKWKIGQISLILTNSWSVMTTKFNEIQEWNTIRVTRFSSLFFHCLAFQCKGFPLWHLGRVRYLQHSTALQITTKSHILIPSSNFDLPFFLHYWLCNMH